MYLRTGRGKSYVIGTGGLVGVDWGGVVRHAAIAKLP